MELILIVALGAALAGFVQGLSGFGFGLTAMSLWAWTLEPQLAAALAVFGGLTGQIIAAVSVRRGFNLARLLPFVLGGLAGLPLGIYVLPRLDVPLFKGLLGLLLVVMCPLMFFAARLPRITHGGRTADAVAGAAGGVMGGLGGFTGVVPTLWCTLRGFEKDVQRAVIQNFNLAMLAVTFVELYRHRHRQARDAAALRHRRARDADSHRCWAPGCMRHQRNRLSQGRAGAAHRVRHRPSGGRPAGPCGPLVRRLLKSAG